MNTVRVKSDGKQLQINIEKIRSDFLSSSSYLTIDMFLSGLPKLADRSPDQYVISIEGTIEESVLEFLHAVRDEFNEFEIKYDETVSKNIESYKKRREDFAKFSEDARKIRDDTNHDYSKLDGFETSLTKLKRKLRWHQKLSAYHLAFARNACNFSVPGAGKTSVVYAAYNYLLSIGEVEKIVVIGPLSSAIAWENEYQSVFGEKPTFLQISGKTPSKDILKIYQRTGPDVVHLTYQSINRYVETLRYLCSKYKVMMVLDEAHRIKNVEGYWIKGLDELISDAESSPVCRVVLTGTPAPNGYKDLYNLYKFIWPHNKVIGFTPKQLETMSKNPEKPSSKQAVSILVNEIAPYFIRIKKADLQLPPITINPAIIAPMDSDQKAIHDFFIVKFLAINRTANRGSAFGARLIRLRQAASNPALLLDRLPIEDYPIDDSFDVVTDDIRLMVKNYVENKLPPKFETLKDLVNSIAGKGRRVIIWCEFVKTMQMLADYLSHSGIDSRLLNGGTDQEARKEIINEFNTPDPSFQVIIANPQAVGESISLHHYCHDAIYFEMSYNAGNFMQSKDRIHRLGLPPNTETYYHFIHSDAPIEREIKERVVEKERLMVKLIDSEEIPLIVNNKEWFAASDGDLRSLIKAYERYD